MLLGSSRILASVFSSRILASLFVVATTLSQARPRVYHWKQLTVFSALLADEHALLWAVWGGFHVSMSHQNVLLLRWRQELVEEGPLVAQVALSLLVDLAFQLLQEILAVLVWHFLFFFEHLVERWRSAVGLWCCISAMSFEALEDAAC